MPLGTEVGLGPSDVVLNGDPLPPAAPPILAHVYCGQTVRWIKMKLGMEVGLGPDHILSEGTKLPVKKGAQQTWAKAHVCCGQTAGWIKMPLGTEVGLGPGDIVLDWDPLPQKIMGAQHPNVGPRLLWSNGWMD